MNEFFYGVFLSMSFGKNSSNSVIGAFMHYKDGSNSVDFFVFEVQFTDHFVSLLVCQRCSSGRDFSRCFFEVSSLPSGGHGVERFRVLKCRKNKNCILYILVV